MLEMRTQSEDWKWEKSPTLDEQWTYVKNEEKEIGL
jgi:hypothetical protein